MDNITLARRLTAYADSLGEHDADLYRRRAFRSAAETLLRLDVPAADILATSGRKGLLQLPGIGRSVAAAIDQLVRTGDFVPRPRRRRLRLRCGLVDLPREQADTETLRAG